ncbi:MAG TPA: nucleotidyltransferase family protein [Thermomicrobiales bacterium]|jgi:molybdenum cofactor cytidylyltransferase|nr:nucleotidyltransferase family protein [Thermomicrobiales bacterium]
MAEIRAVVLAAGSSSRLGRPKQLLELGGEPLLNHVLRTAGMSRVDGTILVLGHATEPIAGQVGDFGQITVTNPDYASGQSSSLRAGVAALPATTGAALILLGDQPLVTAALIDRMVETWQATGRTDAIIQARYGDIPAPPVVIGRDLFAQIERLEGDTGARDLIRANRDRVIAVATGEPEPFDVDTDEDYQRLRRQWSSRQVESSGGSDGRRE